MEKETIIIRLRASINFTNETILWLNQIGEISKDDEQLIWFARDNGQDFFKEYRRVWENALTETTDDTIQNYFRELGLNEDILPKTVIVDSYPGSWVIDAVVAISGSVGTVYTIMKGVSEIPDMIEGLKKLKDMIANKFHHKVDRQARELLSEQAASRQLLPPPDDTIYLKDFVLDARPLDSLKPGEMKSHSVHLQIAVSKDIFTLENLGDEIIENVDIGLFVSENRRNQWRFADAYVSHISILSPKQTVSKNIEDFVKATDKLEITALPVHVDCWVQDAYGIYLFNFYIDK